MFRRYLSVILVLSLLSVLVSAGAEAAFDAFIDDTGTEVSAQDGESSSTLIDPEEGVVVQDISDYPVLNPGDVDVDGTTAYIVTLQSRLIKLGYLATGADGKYGMKTEEAVKSFQQNNGLPVTGIADVKTQNLLYSDMSQLVLGGNIDTSTSGSDAYRIQSKLGQWGFLASAPDGALGNESRDAIAAFKSYINSYYLNQLPTPIPTSTPEPTAEPTQDPNTLPEMSFTPLATPSSDGTTASIAQDSKVDETLMSFVTGGTHFPVYRKTVRTGDTGIEVRRVQNRLKNLNYLYNNTGNFGEITVRALCYFQQKNGLTVTGQADEETQKALFSEAAIASEEYVFPYKLIVDISEQRVRVMGWDGNGYNYRAYEFICSTGKDETPTPLGTYQAVGPSSQGEWYYFNAFNCYAMWATRIVGGVLFHSVTFNSRKELNSGSVKNLGTQASHGCVRLSIEDAKWIYDNCPPGTTVVIQE